MTCMNETLHIHPLCLLSNLKAFPLFLSLWKSPLFILVRWCFLEVNDVVSAHFVPKNDDKRGLIKDITVF